MKNQSSPRPVLVSCLLALAFAASTGFEQSPRQLGRFATGLVASISKGYAVGVQVGPFSQYWPARWLGVQASACYLNDAYLFFTFYRVHGVQLSADVAFRFWRISVAFGPVMDYYFAPVVDKRIWGWHVDVGLRVVELRHFGVDFAAGYRNRVDLRLYQRAWLGHEWGDDWPPHPAEILLHNMPEVHCGLRFDWIPKGGR